MRTLKDWTYMANLANTIMRELRVSNSFQPGSPRAVYGHFQERIKAKMSSWLPETLGRVASFVGGGMSSLREIHDGGFLPPCSNGREYLIELACCAVCAEIYDLCNKRARIQCS